LALINLLNVLSPLIKKIVCIMFYFLKKWEYSEAVRMIWAGHVARMGRRKGCAECWWGNLRERGHWGDPDVDGRIILRWIFRKLEGVVGTGWSWLSIGSGGGHL
jgi:hypothetical protein